MDDLMHFCWKDRTSNAVVEDLIIFPDEAELIPVPQATRVYVLKFKSSSQRVFFWIQEPEEDNDVELITRFNYFINNPPTPGSAGGTMGASHLAALLGQMSGYAELVVLRDQLMESLRRDTNL